VTEPKTKLKFPGEKAHQHSSTRSRLSPRCPCNFCLHRWWNALTGLLPWIWFVWFSGHNRPVSPSWHLSHTLNPQSYTLNRSPLTLSP